MSDPNDSTGVRRTQDNRRGSTIFRDPATGREILRMTRQPNGLTVIDLECEEALFFAKHFLPPTSVVLDRPGKPKSRYVYRTRAA